MNSILLVLLTFSIFIFSPQIMAQQIINDCNYNAKISNINNGFLAGDIDISGNQITIEATINSIGAYSGSNSVISQDIVSKHKGSNDANYLLRINHAEITTTNGFYTSDFICEPTINKTFHIAMVYDGISLKFYRNGLLMSDKPCIGNLVQNNWNTTIGTYAAQAYSSTSATPQDETFNGFINEVRIWKIARNATEINEYKDKSLPNPTTQNGLLAYYQFNDLKNKQGNSNYDLQLLGNPTINQTNPSCELASEPCPKCSLTASFEAQKDICNTMQFLFNNTTDGATNYVWSFGDPQLQNVYTENANVQYKSAGNYEVELRVSDDKGCASSAKKTVTVNLPISAVSTASTSICKNTTIQLKSAIEENNAQYKWSPEDLLSDASVSNPVASPNSTTVFSLEVIKENGCKDTGTVNISVIDPAEFSVSPLDTTVCVNNAVTVHATGGDHYSWKNGNGDEISTSPEIKVSPDGNTEYTLLILSELCNEQKTFNSSIHIFPDNDLKITSSNEINCGNTKSILSIRNAENVEWQPAESLTTKGLDAEIAPTQSTTYYAKAEDQFGCNYNLNYTQNLQFDLSNTHFFVPSAFSPNNDGKNDIFRVSSDLVFNRFILRIYNRFGQLLFESQRADKGWDGKYKKQLQPMGTYIYEVFANSNFCGEFSKKGTIVILK